MKELLLLEIQKVLEAVPSIQKVSHGKSESIITESDFNSVYIMPELSTFVNRSNTKSKSGYWELFPVSLLVHTNNNTPLDWVKVEEDIIKFMLDDSNIWTTIVDRELVTIGYDRFENFPKREFIIQFEFKLQSSC